jgi:ABC-type amino acid transport system permease subunit
MWQFKTSPHRRLSASGGAVAALPSAGSRHRISVSVRGCDPRLVIWMVVNTSTIFVAHNIASASVSFAAFLETRSGFEISRSSYLHSVSSYGRARLVVCLL